MVRCWHFTFVFQAHTSSRALFERIFFHKQKSEEFEEKHVGVKSSICFRIPVAVDDFIIILNMDVCI